MHVPSVFGQKKYPFPGMIRLSLGFEPHDELRSRIIGALDSTVLTGYEQFNATSSSRLPTWHQGLKSAP